MNENKETAGADQLPPVLTNEAPVEAEDGGDPSQLETPAARDDDALPASVEGIADGGSVRAHAAIETNVAAGGAAAVALCGVEGTELEGGEGEQVLNAEEEDRSDEALPKPEEPEQPALSGGPSLVSDFAEGNESGTEDEQTAFMQELETFHRENSLELKPPKFYGEGLNCLKLWRAVTKLGGYDQVTSSKLWRQVGESFRPPKTCTTVSWTFRIFMRRPFFSMKSTRSILFGCNGC